MFTRLISVIALSSSLFLSSAYAARPLYSNYFLAGYYRVFPSDYTKPFVKSVQFGFSIDMGGNIQGILNTMSYINYNPYTGFPPGRQIKAKGHFVGPVRGDGYSARARIVIVFRDGSRIRGTLSATSPAPNVLGRYYTNCIFRGTFDTPHFKALRLHLAAEGQFIPTDDGSWYLDSDQNWNPNIGF